MTDYHDIDLLETPEAQALRSVLQEWEAADAAGRDFQELERKVRQAVMKLEAELLERGLARLDVGCDEIEVDGKCFKRLDQRTEGSYVGLPGELRVSRHLYAPVDGGRPICPLELRAGIIEGTWTPSAAELMAHSVAVMTPYEAEALLPKFGGFSPSRSSLDRLPKKLSERWEASREAWEKALREMRVVPQGAAIIGVSLDGVTVPMKDGERAEKREEARKQGKQTKGPAGYREAGCGTVTLYDDDGDRLETTRFGRMPESKKVTLHEQLLGETESLLQSTLCPILVMMSDGAKDNWRILREMVVELRQQGLLRPEDPIYWIADFYHATEHLKKATDLFYGPHTPKSYGVHETLRRQLLEEDDGVDRVITRLTYFRNHSSGRTREKLSTELEYFRSRVDQMRYAEFQRLGLPIGTGVVEAACKTLVTQRMKRSGMSWGEGGQGVLTLRSQLQSGRWDSAWELLRNSYRSRISAVRRRGHLRVLEDLDPAA